MVQKPLPQATILSGKIKHQQKRAGALARDYDDDQTPSGNI
jgi:hypothetical protein